MHCSPASYRSPSSLIVLVGNRAEAELTAYDLLFAGGVAGMGSWIVSYPMDYIKSQIQAEPYNKPTKFVKNKWLFDGGFISALKVCP